MSENRIAAVTIALVVVTSLAFFLGIVLPYLAAVGAAGIIILFIICLVMLAKHVIELWKLG